MSLPNNKLTIVVDNPICANANVENSNASYTNSVPSGGTLILPTQSIQNNGVASGFIPSVGTINVTTNSAPTSFTITGRTIDIVVPSGSSPSGVLFKTIEARQRTSYRTGDEGWRSQNGWFDYTPPTNPKAIAELDYTSANFFNVLKNPLVVNGVSSTTRFVDINGLQTFSPPLTAGLVSIDKLTGYMLIRLTSAIISSANWNTTIDFAESYSLVVNGITYDDWYLPTESEYTEFYHQFAGVNPEIDTLTGIRVVADYGNQWTSTTYANATTQAKYYQRSDRSIKNYNKTDALSGVLLIRNARNLITAP
jgi:hypothetical protein